MATADELTRLAAMGNALRPDWPTNSLRSHLAANHGTRSYRDLAVALAWICTDPETRTPARLSEAGPWWVTTTRHDATPTPRAPRCEQHPDVRLIGGICHECTSFTPSPRPADFAERVEASRAAHQFTPQEDQ